MKCPTCGAAEMVHDTRDLPYTYKGETTTISAVTGDFCPACGESITDFAESSRVSADMLAFNREVNATRIEPAEIAETRVALKLSQRDASVLFGGGINAFNRYEAGATRPPLSLVQLLRLLRNHPELLEEVRSNSPAAAQARPLGLKQPMAKPLPAALRR